MVRSDLYNFIAITLPLLVAGCGRDQGAWLLSCLPARQSACQRSIRAAIPRHDVSLPAQTSSGPLRSVLSLLLLLLDSRCALGNPQSIPTIRGTYTNNERLLIRRARVDEMDGAGVSPR